MSDEPTEVISIKKSEKVPVEPEIKAIKDEMAFTPEEYEIIYTAIGSVKVSLSDPMLPKLSRIQKKIREIAANYSV